MGKLRVFARFQSKEEHEALVEGLLRAGRLRQQIELYRTYRAMGVRTLEQARQYEATRKLRERDLKARKHKESAPYLFQPSQQQQGGEQLGQGWDAAEEGGLGEGSGKGRRRGRDSSANLAGEEAGSSSSSGAAVGARKRAALGGADDSAPQFASRASSAGAAPSGSQLVSPGRGAGAAAGAVDESETAALLARAPGGDLLSDQELHFCAQVPLMPLHYLAAKDAIVR